MFLLENPRAERVGRVVVKDRHGRLTDDRSAVELARDEVDRGAGHFRAVVQRLPLRVHAGERREERRMDVEDGVREGVEERGSEEPHESREADERQVARSEFADENLLEGVARWMVAVGDRQRLDAGVAGARESLRVGAVGDDECDLRVEASVRDGVDQRLKVAPRPEISTPIRRVMPPPRGLTPFAPAAPEVGV